MEEETLVLGGVCGVVKMVVWWRLKSRHGKKQKK